MRLIPRARSAVRWSMPFCAAVGLAMVVLTPPASFASAAQPTATAAPPSASETISLPSDDMNPSIPDAVVQGVNEPPSITLEIVIGTGGRYHLVGHVSDDGAVNGLTVQFGGGPNCVQNKTIPTDANGNYDLIIDPAAGETGQIWAKVTDSRGAASNVATYYLIP